MQNLASQLSSIACRSDFYLSSPAQKTLAAQMAVLEECVRSSFGERDIDQEIKDAEVMAGQDW